MAGTAAYTSRSVDVGRDVLTTINVTWTADGSGDVSVTGLDFDGHIQSLETNPAAAGVQPDDQYVVTVTDADGIDVLGGAGADCDETNSEKFSVDLWSFGPHTFVVASAGASNQGVARLQIMGKPSGAIADN